MGLFDSIFKKEKKQIEINEYFKTFSAYTPAFTTFEGGLYEMDLTRAVVHSFATHVSKLKPEINGAKEGNRSLERRLQFRPNPYQDTTKFLYRIATILSVQNNAFIVPVTDDFDQIVGYFPLLPAHTKLVSYRGDVYVVYQFADGSKAAIELERTGIINQYQYRDDFFGEDHKALQTTLDLMHTQNEGIIEAIKSSASIRFLAKLANILNPTDMERERKRFRETQLGPDNEGGVLLFDNKYQEIKQIDSKPYFVNPNQIAQIKDSVYTYFNTNENILQNKYNSTEWTAYYEGKIEPFAIQLSLVMSNMTFTNREIAHGNQIIFTANRLQYLSNTEKLNTVTQLFDRGFLTHNQGLEIFNMSGIGEEGDKRYIRREYAESQYLDDDVRYGEVNADEETESDLGSAVLGEDDVLSEES